MYTTRVKYDPFLFGTNLKCVEKICNVMNIRALVISCIHNRQHYYKVNIAKPNRVSNECLIIYFQAPSPQLKLPRKPLCTPRYYLILIEQWAEGKKKKKKLQNGTQYIVAVITKCVLNGVFRNFEGPVIVVMSAVISLQTYFRRPCAPRRRCTSVVFYKIHRHVV